jgi:YVTN family beta-propeller protein
MKKNIWIQLALPLSLLPLLGSQCDNGVLFKEIGNELAAPIAVAVDTAAHRAYVVNSNNTVEFTSTTFTVLDITDPAAPVILDHPNNPFPQPDFSGQIYFDPAKKVAYVPNRESDDATDTVDALLLINLDESSADFGTIQSFTAGENPFGIACCDALGRIYVVNSGGDGDGTLDVYDPADLSTRISINLSVTSRDHGQFDGSESSEVIFLGDRAFVTSRFGNLYVINTNDVGVNSKNPIDAVVFNDKDGDYRGLATDGTLIYVVDAHSNVHSLRVIDPNLIPIIDPDVAAIDELDIAAVQTTAVEVGKRPNEVAVFKGRAYVSNEDDDTVTVIDLSSNTVVATIPVGDEPFGITPFTADGVDYVYVTNIRGDSISIIDPATDTVINTFKP